MLEVSPGMIRLLGNALADSSLAVSPEALIKEAGVESKRQEDVIIDRTTRRVHAHRDVLLRRHKRGHGVTHDLGARRD